MNKKETYELLLKQIAALIEGESDNEIGVLANVAAALHYTFDTFFWTGFYFLRGEKTLKLGPFQGTTACFTTSRAKPLAYSILTAKNSMLSMTSMPTIWKKLCAFWLQKYTPNDRKRHYIFAQLRINT